MALSVASQSWIGLDTLRSPRREQMAVFLDSQVRSCRLGIAHLGRRLRDKKDLGIPTIKHPVLYQAPVWEEFLRFSPRGHRDA